jgi:hypothetical protein
MKHRGFNFDIAAIAESVSHARDDCVADLESAPGIGIDDEVGVSLAESSVNVRETMPFVGHRAQCLREQLHFRGLDAQLALAGGHHGTACADPVTHI